MMTSQISGTPEVTWLLGLTLTSLLTCAVSFKPGFIITNTSILLTDQHLDHLDPQQKPRDIPPTKWPRVLKVGLIIPYKGDHSISPPYATSAISIAERKINATPYLLPSLSQIEVKVVDSECSETEGPFAAIEMFYQSPPIHLFLGPVCDFSLSGVAGYSSVWNISVITPAGMPDGFDNKDEYKTLTRLFQGPYSMMKYSLQSLFNKYQWRHITFFYYLVPRTSQCYYALQPTYQNVARTPNMTAYQKNFDPDNMVKSYRQLLLEISKLSRSE